MDSNASKQNLIGVYRRTPQGGIVKNSSAAILILLTAACAPLEWRKDGADAVALERDTRECQSQAITRAQHEAPLFGLARPPVVGMDTRGRVVTGHAGRHDTDRAILEHDFMRACMRERGYELAPREKP
jgi:hypothetical protein